MRLRHHSGRIVHLSSGTNVRPARDLPAVVEQLDTYAAAIRARLGVDTLGVSLWLPPTLAAALAVDGRSRTRLRAELDARGLEVVTLSGVPYAEGGGEDRPATGTCPTGATRPASSTPSTWPASWSTCCPTTRSAARSPPSAWAAGSAGTPARRSPAPGIMGRLSAGLAEVAWHTGRAVRVGFQPEPGCVLDATESDRRRAGPGRQGPDRGLPRPGQPRLHLGGAGRGPGPARRRPASRSSGPRSPRPSRSPSRPRPRRRCGGTCARATGTR